MRVVVAPAAFKGTLSAAETARAIAAGWRDADARAELDEIPVADGGDGTLDALVSALDGERHHAQVTGPSGDPVEAKYAVAMTPGGALAIVEMAEASGLLHVSERRRDPLRATTRGTGELLLAAARHGPGRVLVGVGGSATNDAGAGMAQALGVRLLDRGGRDLGPGGAALRQLARIDATGLDRSVRDVDMVVLWDVENPLVGPNGASTVYGPQKGASPDDVAVLEEAVAHFAAVAHRDLGIDLRHVRGGGAAGGLAAGLLGFLGARLRRGFDMVADLLNLRARFEGSSVVVTGEGRYDRQSERGKAPFGVLRMAAEAGCRTVLIAGQVEDGVDPPADIVLALGDRPGPDAEDRVRDAAREAARRVTALVEE